MTGAARTAALRSKRATREESEERVAELYRMGFDDIEIAGKINRSKALVRRRVIDLRRAGRIEPRPAKRGIALQVEQRVLDAFEAEAAKRNTTTRKLMALVLAGVASDDLFKAVLDI